MVSLNVLEELRTKEELINYFKAMGKNITEEEIEKLKKNYEETQETDSALSLKQLDDVAGGTGHIYRIKIHGNLTGIQITARLTDHELLANKFWSHENYKRENPTTAVIIHNEKDGKKDIVLHDLTKTDVVFDGAITLLNIQDLISRPEVRTISIDLKKPAPEGYEDTMECFCDSVNDALRCLTINTDLCGKSQVALDYLSNGPTDGKPGPGFKVFIDSYNGILDAYGKGRHFLLPFAGRNGEDLSIHIKESSEPGIHIFGTFDEPVKTKNKDEFLHQGRVDPEILLAEGEQEHYVENRLVIKPGVENFEEFSEDGSGIPEDLFSTAVQIFFHLHEHAEKQVKFAEFAQEYGLTLDNPNFLTFAEHSGAHL